MKSAKEIIWQKRTPKNFINGDTLVLDALKQLIDIDLSYLIVKENDKVTGVFSERDYARKVILQGRTSDKTTVKEIMTTDIPEVRLEDSVQKCMNILAEHGRRYILVTNNNKFEGIITIHDLLREVLLHGERVFDNHVTSALIDINENPPKVY